VPEESRPRRSYLTKLYERRFTEADLAFKREMWRVLVEDYFQRYVTSEDTVLDLGAGSCEFINAVSCRRKLAVDLNPVTAHYAEDAEVVRAPGHDMASIASASVDVVFASNFFEHMPNKDVLLDTLMECRRVLRPAGTLLVLQPNIRYLPGRFWDYLDHHTPLTHLSMAEALQLAGFTPTEVIPRFLPYTVQNTVLPRSVALIRFYLRVRPAWSVLGRQMFIVAERSSDADVGFSGAEPRSPVLDDS
jgi:SAM-dependent methyltransferase